MFFFGVSRARLPAQSLRYAQKIILEIVSPFLWLCSIGTTKPSPNPGANSANLFLREPGRRNPRPTGRGEKETLQVPEKELEVDPTLESFSAVEHQCNGTVVDETDIHHLPEFPGCNINARFP